MIETLTTKTSYAGNGTTDSFAFPYYFLDSSHLTVIVDGVTQLLNTDYKVTGAGVEAGGTVTLVTAPDTGVTVTITRRMPITQLIDYVKRQNFPADTHERALDRLTMICQELYVMYTDLASTVVSGTATGGVVSGSGDPNGVVVGTSALLYHDITTGGLWANESDVANNDQWHQIVG